MANNNQITIQNESNYRFSSKMIDNDQNTGCSNCLKYLFDYWLKSMGELPSHLPFVKSGKVTDWPLPETDCSDNGETALLVTESYTSK